MNKKGNFSFTLDSDRALGFLEDFAQESAISAYPQSRRLYAGLYLAHVSTKARSVKVKFAVIK